jgi:uncharacterized protein YdaU (DUF1376 family)
MENPWFKLWARDLLTDPKVDSTPEAAMFLVVKMWCVCCLEGSCPADLEEIARKTRVSLQKVLQCHPHCKPFFDERDGRLYSRRMERDRAKSHLAQQNAQKRYATKTSAKSPAVGTANGSADSSAQKNRSTEAQRAENQKVQEREQHAPESGAPLLTLCAPAPAPISKVKRLCEMPDDFEPNDVNRVLAAELGVNLEAAVAKFSDSHRSKGNKFKDWNLALNTWLRNEPKFAPVKNAVSETEGKVARRLHQQMAVASRD